MEGWRDVLIVLNHEGNYIRFLFTCVIFSSFEYVLCLFKAQTVQNCESVLDDLFGSMPDGAS